MAHYVLVALVIIVLKTPCMRLLLWVILATAVLWDDGDATKLEAMVQTSRQAQMTHPPRTDDSPAASRSMWWSGSSSYGANRPFVLEQILYPMDRHPYSHFGSALAVSVTEAGDGDKISTLYVGEPESVINRTDILSLLEAYPTGEIYTFTSWTNRTTIANNNTDDMNNNTKDSKPNIFAPEPSSAVAESSSDTAVTWEVVTSNWTLQQRLQTSKTNPSWRSIPVGGRVRRQQYGLGTNVNVLGDRVLATGYPSVVFRCQDEGNDSRNESACNYVEDKTLEPWWGSYYVIDLLMAELKGIPTIFGYGVFVDNPNVIGNSPECVYYSLLFQQQESVWQVVDDLSICHSQPIPDDESNDVASADVRGKLYVTSHPSGYVHGFAEAGYVTVNELRRGKWDTTHLHLEDINSKAHFGESFAILSTTEIAVGAPTSDQGRGGVFVFQRSSLSEWRMVYNITLPRTQGFGSDMLANEKLLLVRDAENSLYVFERGEIAGASWEMVQRLENFTSGINEGIIALDGDQIILPDPTASVDGVEEVGAVYVLARQDPANVTSTSESPAADEVAESSANLRLNVSAAPTASANPDDAARALSSDQDVSSEVSSLSHRFHFASWICALTTIILLPTLY